KDVGDGKHTVKELVTEKNKNPLRGTNHRAPLEEIQLGENEQLMQKGQGYTIDSIPENGKRDNIRENSNISTDAESMDMTDLIHQTYKDAAVQMTKTIDAKVCGVDLIIPDYQKLPKVVCPGYTVIEANFIPAMHMHAFVSEGKGRPLTIGILK